tara:strand:+ start:462 stop:677 length:216 start_codon:yes stop_codon:yes gene_type:complete
VKIPGNEFRVIGIKSKDIQKARRVAHKTSAIRRDKVEQVKLAIADGSFHVGSRDLAEKLLKEVITESKFLG